MYRCPAKGTGHVGKRVGYVDELVNRYAAAFREMGKRAEVAHDVDAEIVVLETEAAGLRRRLDDFVIEAAEGVITPGQMRALTEHARAKIAGHESRMAELRLAAERPVWSADEALPVVSGVALAAWLGLSVDDRRDWLRHNLDVTLLPHGRGSTKVFDPETVRVLPKGYDPAVLATRERRAAYREWFDALPAGA